LIQLVKDRLEVVVGLDPVDQVIRLSLLLDHGAGLMRQNPNLFVALLTISAVPRRKIYFNF
jgi:hypothetical protein